MGFQGVVRTQDVMIVLLDNNVYNVQSDHPNFDVLREAYQTGAVNTFKDNFDIASSVQTYVEDGAKVESPIKIVNGKVFYDGQEVNNAVVEAIQRMLKEGFDIKPMVKFLENLMKCPSYNSVQEMWKFIEQAGLTITDDGCFLAHKAVRQDYRDKYTGTIDNTPGQKPPRMARCTVDDNPSNHCSKGYHVGALGYAGPGGWYHSEGDKVLICKVNPADVVSVPNDHSCQKLRCCYYEPVGEFKCEFKRSVYSGEVGDDYAEEASIKRFRVERVYNQKLMPDNFYIADYTDKVGKTSRRYFLVEQTYRDLLDGLRYIVELVEPEEHSGDYRTFLADRLQNVVLWDGISDPEMYEMELDEMNDVEYPDLDEDDEDDYHLFHCSEELDNYIYSDDDDDYDEEDGLEGYW